MSEQRGEGTEKGKERRNAGDASIAIIIAIIADHYPAGPIPAPQPLLNHLLQKNPSVCLAEAIPLFTFAPLKNSTETRISDS